MSTDTELAALVGAVQRHPATMPLRCACGGTVRLDGPGERAGTVRYLCTGACGSVRASLADLVRSQVPR